MRMLFVLAGLFASAAIAAERPDGEPGGKTACKERAVIADSKPKAVGARPLGQEPDARHLQAVMRRVDGCSQPAVLRDRVGTGRR